VSITVVGQLIIQSSLVYTQRIPPVTQYNIFQFAAFIPCI